MNISGRFIAAGIFGVFVAFCLLGFAWSTGHQAGLSEVAVAGGARVVEAAAAKSAELRAQQDSARWAWWAVFIASIQIPVGLFGLWALLRSLGQTDKSLREARRSADFAGESHLAFLRLEDASLLMTLVNGSLRVEKSGSELEHRIWRFEVSFANVGRSTALIHSVIVTNGDWITLSDAPIPATGDAVSIGNINVEAEGPGSTFDCEVTYSTSLSGRRSLELSCTIMPDSRSPYRFVADVINRELPPILRIAK